MSTRKLVFCWGVLFLTAHMLESPTDLVRCEGGRMWALRLLWRGRLCARSFHCATVVKIVGLPGTPALTTPAGMT